MISFVEIDGQRIEVLDVAGQGEQKVRPFVLLHEGLGSVSLWRDFPHKLAQRTGARVLTYSRAGYGQSTPHPPGARNVYDARYMHTEAKVTLPRLLAALNVSRPHLVGHSDGGTIALIFAATFPEALTSVVAMAPHCFVEEISTRSIAQARRSFESAPDLSARLSKHHRDPEATFYGWNDVWLSSEFGRFDITALLPAIRVPVLAVQGEDDAYGTMRQIDEIARNVPTAQLLKLAKCGHAPWKDCPDEVLSAIAQHCACE